VPPAAAASSSVPRLPADRSSIVKVLFGIPSHPYDSTPESPLPGFFTWRAELASAAVEYCAATDHFYATRAAMALADSRVRTAGLRYNAAVSGCAPFARCVLPDVDISDYEAPEIADHAESFLTERISARVFEAPPASSPLAPGPPARLSARALGKRPAAAPGESDESIDSPSDGVSSPSPMDE
jgi:hypothetical protein